MGRVHIGEDGWAVFHAGEQVACPACGMHWGFVGHGFIYKVRINQAGALAGPGRGVGYSERCKNRSCRQNVERQQLRV